MRNGQLFGVDVSVFQGDIDWNAAKSDGVDFAMIKATQGHDNNNQYFLFTDSRFNKNIVNAHEAGIPCGAYHFFTARSYAETISEANYFVNILKPHRDKIKLWTAIDIEDHWSTSNTVISELTEYATAFMKICEQCGFEPLLYTNRQYMNGRLAMSRIYEAFPNIGIWQAHWAASMPNDVGRRLKIWQYTSAQKGTVNGINAAVDLNYGYFNLNGNSGEDEMTYDQFKEFMIRYENEAGLSEPDEWAVEPRKWAIDNNISDGTYPQKAVKRQELWTMLYRFFNNFIK